MEGEQKRQEARAQLEKLERLNMGRHYEKIGAMKYR